MLWSSSAHLFGAGRINGNKITINKAPLKSVAANHREENDDNSLIKYKKIARSPYKHMERCSKSEHLVFIISRRHWHKGGVKSKISDKNLWPEKIVNEIFFVNENFYCTFFTSISIVGGKILRLFSRRTSFHFKYFSHISRNYNKDIFACDSFHLPTIQAEALMTLFVLYQNLFRGIMNFYGVNFMAI